MSVGLDLGSHALKAVRLGSGKGKTLRVLGAGRVRLPSEEGEDAAERVRGPLARMAKEARLGSTGALVGLSGRDLNLRFTQVPPVSPAKVRQMMQHEMVQIVGQSGGTVYTDYVRLDYPWKPMPIPMIVALAKQPFVEERMTALRGARIKVRDLTPNALALWAAYAGTGAATAGETVLLVDIGAANMELAVVRDDKLVFARNLASGARAYTEALAGQLDVSFEKAEKIKISEGSLAPGGADRHRQVLSTPAGQMQSVISSTLGFAKQQTQLADLALDRVLLSGGGAGLHGLTDFLAKSLGKPVEVFDPFAKLDLSALPAERADALRAGGSDMAIAVGLAVLGRMDRSARLSLLPDAIKARRHFLANEIFLYAGAAVLLLALLANWNVARGSRAIEAAFQQELTDQRDAIQAKMADFEEAAKKRDALATKVDLAARETRPGVSLMNVLAAARDALPEGVWLTRIRLAPRGDDAVPEARDGPVIVVEGTIGEAGAAASSLMGAFKSELEKGLRDARVLDRLFDRAPDSDRTIFQLLVVEGRS